MFYTLTLCGWHGDGIHLKFTQNSLKTLEMVYYEVGDFSWKGVAMTTRRISMSRHEISKPYNLTPHGLIFSKFHMLVKSPGLNTLSGPYLVRVIAPPTGNRKYHASFFVVLLLGNLADASEIDSAKM